MQRVKAGQVASLDTRRALARAFGLPLDQFDELYDFPSEEELREQQRTFERDYVILDPARTTGHRLLRLMLEGRGFGSLSWTGVDELPPRARRAFAAIADHARDCLDVVEDATQTELTDYCDAIDMLIADLGAAGFCLYAATRQVNLRSDSWPDQTPLPCHIAYLVAAPVDRRAVKIAALRKVELR